MKNKLSLTFGGNLKITEYGIYLENSKLEDKIREEIGCGSDILRLDLTIKPIPGIGLSVETEDAEPEE